MRKFPLLCLTIAGAVSALAQRPSVTIGPGQGGANFRVPFHQTGSRTLHKDTTYILTGWYFVDSLANITIQPGTLITGDSASGGTLIIKRGGKINANGTSALPIVFTSAKGPGQRKSGDWGGVVILGSAPTNKPTTQQIEGGFGTIANTDAQYGGSNADDSSGIFRYARIEFGGIAYATDNEINGLTLGGVGRKTQVDHVQVSFGGDDDFEFFGGSVDAKHLVSWRNTDDCFDTDFGYSGRLQFLYAKRDSTLFDASTAGSSNGFESDNEASGFTATPRTSARLSNVTIIGPYSDTSVSANAKWAYVAMLRRATELSIYNSILVGYPFGIQLRDTLTQRAAINNNLEIRNTSLQAKTNVLALSSSPSTGNIAGFDIAAWFTTGGYGNNGSTARRAIDVGITSTAFALNGSNNPVPAASSEGATAGGAFNVGRLNGDSWFTTVTYRGAFDPALAMSAQWTAGWTNWSPENTNYANGVTGVEQIAGAVPSEFSLEQNFPNPFNPSTTIEYSLPKADRVRLSVYNMLGQEVATLFEGNQEAGQYKSVFDAKTLTSGVYFYKLSTSTSQQIRKMVLMK